MRGGMSTLRGADVIARTLARAGATHLFSLSGNHVMSIYDAALDAGLEIVHTRHEGAAVHMADAWGRLTGEPGIVLLTGGPGHANGVGALYTALASESPLVMLSGHAPLNELGMGSFQEMRQAEMAAPVVKEAWTAERAENLADDIARALQIATAGSPGRYMSACRSICSMRTFRRREDCRPMRPHAIRSYSARRLACSMTRSCSARSRCLPRPDGR